MKHTFRVPNSLDLDQARRSVGSGCRLSADDNSPLAGKELNMFVKFALHSEQNGNADIHY